MQDPTRAEIDAAIAAYPFRDEVDAFDIEEAIYAFASDWHGGQASNLYSVLSTSPFRPGAMWSGCDAESAAQYIYDHLDDIFGGRDQ